MERDGEQSSSDSNKMSNNQPFTGPDTVQAFLPLHPAKLLKFPFKHITICLPFSHITQCKYWIVYVMFQKLASSRRVWLLTLEPLSSSITWWWWAKHEHIRSQWAHADYKVQFHFQLCWICKSSVHNSQRDNDEGANKWLHNQQYSTVLVSNGILHGTRISRSTELLNALLHSLNDKHVTDLRFFCWQQILFRDYWKKLD